MIDRDPNKPINVLLSDILMAAQQQGTPGLALVPMATLLVRLSNEASETSKRNITIQNRMINITLIILGISAIQLITAIISVLS